MNRAIREALEAALTVFQEAGWTCEFDPSGKHPAVVVEPASGGKVRFPLCNTPGHGVEGAVSLARWNARKLVRRYNVAGSK